MIEYILKFIIGGLILVLATYFSKSKMLFFAGIVTTLPLMTIVNMLFQSKYLNKEEFIVTQKNGIFGALGLVLFVSVVFVLSFWLKPTHAIALSLIIYLGYILLLKMIL